MRRQVPLRRSLLVRLLVTAVLLAVCAIAATAWLVMSTTTAAIRQEQGQSLTDDAHIYDALLGYAATHRDWLRVGPAIQALARSTGRRIVLTSPTRRPIATSAPGAPALLAQTPSATVDPLAVDAALVPGAGTDRIDRRAVGPFPRHPAPADDSSGPAPVPATAAPARRHAVNRGSPAPQRRALGRLAALTAACLKRHHHALDPGIVFDDRGAPQSTAAARDHVVATCFARARRRQLRAWVAPAALLFVSSPGGVAATSLDLSSSHRLRIAGVAVIILAVTIAATALVARRLVRPLRALTRAAERMEDGDLSVRVTVHDDDEVGRLAEAFNEMSRRREQLEEQRTAMVSDVAHELRTPVSNIRGWLEAAQDGLATPDPAFVASLLEEATLLHHVIDDLQDLSAAEAGELRLHPERIHLANVLEQAAAAHRLQADATGVTLVVSSDHRLELDADPVRLRQAIGNLVSNAVRHSPPGATVVLRTRADQQVAVIEVIDAGDGISAAHLPYVFDRFWRAEKSRNRRAGGSGLGLAIVRKLVEAHDGSVTVVSAPGAGATFTLRLPLAAERPTAGRGRPAQRS